MPKTPAVVDGRERRRGGFEAATLLDRALPEGCKGASKITGKVGSRGEGAHASSGHEPSNTKITLEPDQMRCHRKGSKARIYSDAHDQDLHSRLSSPVK
jgi:hypothetical protein